MRQQQVDEDVFAAAEGVTSTQKFRGQMPTAPAQRLSLPKGETCRSPQGRKMFDGLSISASVEPRGDGEPRSNPISE